MAQHDPRLVPAAVTVWLGTLLGIVLGWPWTVAFGLAAALFALPCLVARTRAVRVAAWAALVCALVAALWTGIRLHHQQTNPLTVLARREASVALRVELTDLPKPITSAGFAGRPGGVRSVLIVADAISVTEDGGAAVPADGPVLLIAPTRGWADLLRGQDATGWGELTVPLPSADQPVAVLRVRGSPTDVTPPSTVQRLAESLRRGLRSAAAGLPGGDRGLLPAVVVGDRRGVPPPVLDDFRKSGMDYLMAVGDCTSWWSAAPCCGCSAGSVSARGPAQW